jgi:hypothetical protein
MQLDGLETDGKREAEMLLKQALTDNEQMTEVMKASQNTEAFLKNLIGQTEAEHQVESDAKSTELDKLRHQLEAERGSVASLRSELSLAQQTTEAAQRHQGMSIAGGRVDHGAEPLPNFQTRIELWEPRRKGQIVAVHGHSAEQSFVTENVDTAIGALKKAPYSFLMLFTYDEDRPHPNRPEESMSDRQRAIQGAVQFCQQARLKGKSPLRDDRVGEAGTLYAVLFGFCTGLTLSRSAALEAARPAQTIFPRWVERISQSEDSGMPPGCQVTSMGAVQSLFSLRTYRSMHLGETPTDSRMPNPHWPEWMQVRECTLQDQITAVTSYVFRETPLRAVQFAEQGTELVPHEFEWPAMIWPPADALYEADYNRTDATPEATRRPSGGGQELPPLEKLFNDMRASQPTELESPPKAPLYLRGAQKEEDHSRSRVPDREEKPLVKKVIMATVPSSGSEEDHELEGLRSSSSSREKARMRTTPTPRRHSEKRHPQTPMSRRQGHGAYNSDNDSDEGSDTASVQSTASEVEPSKRAKMTETQMNKILNDKAVAQNAQLRKAVRAVYEAPWNPSQTNAAAFSRTINTSPHECGSNEYKRLQQKIGAQALETLRKSFQEALKTYRPSTGPGTSEERKKWWLDKNGRTKLQYVFNEAVSFCIPWGSIYSSLARSVPLHHSVSWMQQLVELMERIHSMSKMPHLAAEIFLFLCDFTVDPGSSDIHDREIRKWKELKPLSSMTETAQTVESLAPHVLDKRADRMYSEAKDARLIINRFTELYEDSDLPQHQYLLPWLKGQMAHILGHDPPEEMRNRPTIAKLRGKEQDHRLIYEYKSVLLFAEEWGMSKEAEALQATNMRTLNVETEGGRRRPRPMRPASPQHQAAALTDNHYSKAVIAAIAALQGSGAIPQATRETPTPNRAGDRNPRSDDQKPNGLPSVGGVGYLGSRNGRPNGQGIVMKGFWEQHPFLHANYPGGKEAFETIPLSAKVRDMMAKAARKHEDDETYQQLGASAPHYRRKTDGPPYYTRYGASADHVDTVTRRFKPDACSHCFNNLPPSPQDHGNGFLFRQNNPEDSAHDWADCPRVKATLCFRGQYPTTESGRDPAYADNAILKRLMVRLPEGVPPVQGRLKCEKASDQKFIASQLPAEVYVKPPRVIGRKDR